MKKYEFLNLLLVIAVTAVCIFLTQEPDMSYEEHAALMTALDEYEIGTSGDSIFTCYSNGTVYHKEEHDDIVTYYLDHETTEYYYDFDGNGTIAYEGSGRMPCKVDMDKETRVIVSYVMTNNEASDLDEVFSAKALNKYERQSTITSPAVYGRWEREQREKVLKALENESCSGEVQQAIERLSRKLVPVS